jgi:hypothetical protein
MRTSLLLLLSATCAMSEPKPGDEGKAAYKNALELVKQLGSTQFAAREAAAKKLIEMDEGAIPALMEGAKSDDEEVRTRSITLLAQAKAAYWKRRAATYLADTEGKQEHDLPLLAEWRKVMGKRDATNCNLFAEMVKTNGEFLAEVASDKKKSTTVCAARCTMVLSKVQTPKGQLKVELGDLAAVLFVDTLAPVGIDRESRDVPVDLLKNPGLIEALHASEKGLALRKLLVQWVEVQPGVVPAANERFADLVRRKPFPEAVPVLVKLAKDKAPRTLTHRLLAVQALGAVGGKDAGAALVELSANSNLMFVGDMWKDYWEGDSALAASLLMHGKKTKDYELIGSKQHFFPALGEEKIPIDVYGFPNADARARAIKKWKEEVLRIDTKAK